MNNIKIEVGAGDRFSITAERAKRQSIAYDEPCSFVFNGVICNVDALTNLDNLYRMYCDAHTMEWKEVGPDCPDKYSDEVQAVLSFKNEEAEKEAEKEAEIQRAAYRAEAKLKEQVLKEKIADEKMLFAEFGKELYYKGWEINKDEPYGARCFTYADEVARFLQVSINGDETLIPALLDDACTVCDYDGISGFMHSAAMSILRDCWVYGKYIVK